MGHDYKLYGRKMYMTGNFHSLNQLLFTMNDFNGKSGNLVVKMLNYNCKLMEKYWDIKETPVDTNNKNYWWSTMPNGFDMTLFDKLEVYYNYMKLMMQVINEYNSLSPTACYINTHFYNFSISSDQCSPPSIFYNFDKQLVQKIKTNMLLSCMANMMVSRIENLAIYAVDDIMACFNDNILVSAPSTDLDSSGVLLDEDKHLMPAIAVSNKTAPRKKLSKYKYYLKFIQKRNKPKHNYTLV